LTPAVAYLRTSSSGNVGDDKDSERRQRAAIENYTRTNALEIVSWFYDASVSGADPIESRPGFTAMLERIAGNGVRTILVETACRFARDLMVQEVGFRRLQELGIELVAVDSPQWFLDDTPTAVMVRQILGAVSQFDRDDRGEAPCRPPEEASYDRHEGRGPQEPRRAEAGGGRTREEVAPEETEGWDALL
jgi:DNA invertase Pin-like site-specific DNA recombinase